MKCLVVIIACVASVGCVSTPDIAQRNYSGAPRSYVSDTNDEQVAWAEKGGRRPEDAPGYIPEWLASIFGY